MALGPVAPVPGQVVAYAPQLPCINLWWIGFCISIRSVLPWLVLNSKIHLTSFSSTSYLSMSSREVHNPAFCMLTDRHSFTSRFHRLLGTFFKMAHLFDMISMLFSDIPWIIITLNTSVFYIIHLVNTVNHLLAASFFNNFIWTKWFKRKKLAYSKH